MTSPKAAAQRKQTRTLTIVIGGVVPVVVSLVAIALMLSWLPDLPDPIAIHWSGVKPDGFGSAVPMVLLPGGITLAYAAFAVRAAWRTTPSGLPTRNQKAVLVTGVWMSGLLNVGIGGSVAIQRGLSDARDAGEVGPFLLLGALVGLALAVPAWFVLPRAGLASAPTEDPEPMALTASERVSWSRSVRLGNGVLVLIFAAMLLSLGVVVLTAITASTALWFALSGFGTVVVLALATGWWRVTVDRRGLRVVSAFGWPRVVIPLDEIREVHAVQVNPTAEFGGWGWRWDGAGRSGIIMRSGSALQVSRTSGKTFVVTVDDAETAASVLAALVGATAR